MDIYIFDTLVPFRDFSVLLIQHFQNIYYTQGKDTQQKSPWNVHHFCMFSRIPSLLFI